MTDFRINPLLHMRVDNVDGNAALCVDTSSSRPPLIIEDERLAWALTSLPETFDAEQARATWRTEPAVAPAVDDVWDFCQQHELITPIDGCAVRSSYHAATRNHPFLDMAGGYDAMVEDNEIMQEYAGRDDYPSVFLDLPHTESVPLEDALDLEEPQLRADPRQQLALLLSGTFGKRRHLAAYSDREYRYTQLELVFKSIPSGGSKHPTEALLVVERSRYLNPGLHHYSVRRNSVTRIADDPRPALADLSTSAPPAADEHERIWVLFALQVERAMWRYRDPRSFRALLVDIGHAEAHLAALANYVGWRYSTVRAKDLSRLPALFGLESEKFPILTVGVLTQ
jgi:SagB-type dehydrogenase family enzyme